VKQANLANLANLAVTTSRPSGGNEMDRVTVTKVACALAGVGIFAYGVRNDDTIVRWVGIALVVVAFLLRFVKKRPTEEPE